MSNHISKTALCLLMLPASKSFHRQIIIQHNYWLSYSFPTVLYAQLSVRSISITTTSPSNNCTPPEPGGYTLTLQPGATCTLNCSVIVESYDPVLHHILIDFQSGRYFNQSMIGGPLDRGSLGDGVMHSKTIDITEELPHIHCRFLVHDMLFYSQLLPITVNHGTVLLLHTLTTTLCFLHTVTTEPPYSSSSSSILPTPSSSTFTVSSTPNTQQGMGKHCYGPPRLLILIITV